MKRFMMFVCLALCLAFVFSCGGGGGGTGSYTTPPNSGAPVINSFTATPLSINPGGNSTLSWSVSNATSLSIDQGVGPVTGLTSKVVTPAGTTTYRLTATNSHGSTISSPVTVTVTTPGAPQIITFTANPTTVAKGQSSTLSWSVTGATSLSINQNVGSVAGTTNSVVTPSTTTTYTLTATNSLGNTTAPVTVTVTDSATLAWRPSPIDAQHGAADLYRIYSCSIDGTTNTCSPTTLESATVSASVCNDTTPDNCTFTFPGLASGHTYCYDVKAWNSGGESIGGACVTGGYCCKPIP